MSLEERFEIQLGISLAETDSAIAERIGRHRGTVWSEIKANRSRKHYNAARAQQAG